MSEGPFPSSISVLAESSREGNEELLFNKPLIFDAEVLGLREWGFLESFKGSQQRCKPQNLCPLLLCLQSKSWRRTRGRTTPTWAQGPPWPPSGSSWRRGKSPSPQGQHGDWGPVRGVGV